MKRSISIFLLSFLLIGQALTCATTEFKLTINFYDNNSKLVKNKSIKDVSIDENTTIKDLKDMVENKYGYPQEKQNFFTLNGAEINYSNEQKISLINFYSSKNSNEGTIRVSVDDPDDNDNYDALKAEEEEESSDSSSPLLSHLWVPTNNDDDIYVSPWSLNDNSSMRSSKFNTSSHSSNKKGIGPIGMVVGSIGILGIICLIVYFLKPKKKAITKAKKS